MVFVFFGVWNLEEHSYLSDIPYLHFFEFFEISDQSRFKIKEAFKVLYLGNFVEKPSVERTYGGYFDKSGRRSTAAYESSYRRLYGLQAGSGVWVLSYGPFFG